MLSFAGHPGPMGAPQPQFVQAPPQGGQWQSDADASMREQVTHQIYTIFSQRKGGSNSSRLPDFVKRLEEAIYRSARSKEDYLDPTTLEARLQEVARRFVKQQAPAPQQQQQQPQQSFPMQPPAMQYGMGQPGPGPGSGFVPMNGMGVDPMQQRNAAMLHQNGGPGPEGVPLPGPMHPSPPSVFGSNISGSTVMQNGAPVMIKGQAYMNGQSNVPTSSMGMPGAMNGGVGPAVGPSGPAGGFVPISSTGMVPVPVGPSSGMVPVTNGMMQHHPQHSQPVPTMMLGAGGHGGLGGHPQASTSQVGSGMVPVTNGQGLYPAMPVPIGPGGGPLQPGGLPPGPEDQTQVTKKQRWLLFLRHCAKCRQNEQECSLKAQCKFGKQLWHHILHCANPNCEFPRCGNSKELLKHHQKCQDPQCAICVPVKDYVKRTRAQQQANQGGGGAGQPGGAPPGMMQGPPGAGAPMHHMPGMVPNPGGMVPQQGGQYGMPPHRAPPLQGQQGQMMGGGGMAPGTSAPPPMGGQKRAHESGFGGFAGGQGQSSMASGSFQGGQVPGMAVADAPNNKRIKTDRVQLLSQNTGTSLLETFTPENIRTHVESIYQAAAQARAAAPQPPDACKVCGVSRLIFEPPVIYCNGCGLRIKRAQTYYCSPASNSTDIKGAWCHGCFTEMKADRILLEGSNFRKGDLEKKKNDYEHDEHWVQCDCCEGWVHQICGLFNKGRNSQDTHYLCPSCLVEGLQSGQRQRLEVRPQSMLEARELAQNQLSVYLENHMAQAIQEERVARAKHQGMAPYEVPGCDGLSVRVINSVMKKCETKPRFVDTFSTTEGYPTEFAYRQRVIVLFQNLDGVDVCLFVMYVQEYGPHCPKPNTNVVYLSYLDSVKYFRPEGVMAHGCPNPNTSLRTFVYHQLQVAYLNFVKKLGFEQMFIWACPPMQGDDYILYCHPAKQKTPRSDRLRAWYHDMLKDARNKGIVKHMSTLWDTYFEGGKDHRLERCSATQIPYLEGDYWPGEAENLLGLIESGSKGGKKDGSAANRKTSSSKGKRYGGGPATTDEQLMTRLGDILGGNMKEDFIVVHFKEVCTFCRAHVEGSNMYTYHSSVPLRPAGNRTFEGVKIEGGPNVPIGTVTSLAICESCYMDEQRRVAERSNHVRLPQGVTLDRLDCHYVSPEPRLADTDPDIECEHFETRQSFLNLCQGNYYQFDTIRRAKHSSMMVLYHLHNPEAPAFTTTCNVCNNEIESGTGFKCTVCPDFDLCAACQQSTGHAHPLTKHTKRVDETRVRLTEQERRERNEQLQKTMNLLVHACSCTDVNCASSSCKKVRLLFRHAMECPTKVTGGCQMCKKMWCLLNLHAKSCTAPECLVPRCRELKELRRRQAARQEDQRRLAYQKMANKQMKAQQQERQQGGQPGMQ